MTHSKHALQKVLRRWRNNGEIPYKLAPDGRLMGGGQTPEPQMYTVIGPAGPVAARVRKDTGRLLEGALNREAARWSMGLLADLDKRDDA